MIKIMKTILSYAIIPICFAMLAFNLFGRGDFANTASVIAFFIGIGIASLVAD
jgi:hypothetical protein